ncbi:MAG: GatB/YqeY domain-containing protein [Parvularculaceae bacterium]
MLIEQINEELKIAMKAGNQKLKVGTLRLVNAAIKDRDIAARSEDRCGGMTDEDVLTILTKMVKQRDESAKIYEEAGRIELAEQERAETDIIREFMPKQMDDQAIEAAIDGVVQALDADGLKDMGRCMGALKKDHAGAMDFGKAGALLKKRLG